MSSYKVNKHSVKIKAKKEDIFKEIVLWGEASWWPKFSNMRFINQTGGSIKEGTRYLMKIIPFGSSWCAQVTRIEANYSIRRDFLDGMFSGFETVSILEPEKGDFEVIYEVIYEMFYQVNNRINRKFWELFLEKIHNANIERILSSLKESLELK